MSDIGEVWKYRPLKDGIRSISKKKKKKKKIQSRHFVVGRPQNFNLLAYISFDSRFKNVVLLSLMLFLCACYSADLDNIK